MIGFQSTIDGLDASYPSYRHIYIRARRGLRDMEMVPLGAQNLRSGTSSEANCGQHVRHTSKRPR